MNKHWRRLGRFLKGPVLSYVKANAFELIILGLFITFTVVDRNNAAKQWGNGFWIGITSVTLINGTIKWWFGGGGRGWWEDPNPDPGPDDPTGAIIDMPQWPKDAQHDAAIAALEAERRRARLREHVAARANSRAIAQAAKDGDDGYIHEGMEHNPGIKLHNAHLPDRCRGQVCALHNRTDHPMRSFAQVWSNESSVMHRACPHDVAHPDPDDRVVYADPMNETPHAPCDGCCHGAYAHLFSGRKAVQG